MISDYDYGDNSDVPPVPMVDSGPGNINIRSFSEAIRSEWYKLEVNSLDTHEAGEMSINERVGHTLLSYPKTKKIFMIGGGNHSGDLSEVWAIDYSSTSEPLKATLHESRTCFPGRYEFSCASNGQGQAWIFGGANFRHPSNDVVLFDLESEIMVLKEQGNNDESNKDIPTPRTQGNNSCFLVLKGEEYFAVFAGGQKGEMAVPDGDIYLYKIADNQWKRVDVKNKTPEPVQGHAMVAIGTKVYVHGGMQSMKLFDDLYMIDLADDQPEWVKLHPNGDKPCARAAHGIVAINNEFIICGGLGDDGALSDLWKFNSESLEWTLINIAEGKECPSARFDFAMTHISIPAPEGTKTLSILLVHGGMNTQGELFNDYWVYALSF